jgi:hypothetical protein
MVNRPLARRPGRGSQVRQLGAGHMPDQRFGPDRLVRSGRSSRARRDQRPSRGRPLRHSAASVAIEGRRAPLIWFDFVHSRYLPGGQVPHTPGQGDATAHLGGLVLNSALDPATDWSPHSRSSWAATVGWAAGRRRRSCSIRVTGRRWTVASSGLRPSIASWRPGWSRQDCERSAEMTQHQADSLRVLQPGLRRRSVPADRDDLGLGLDRQTHQLVERDQRSPVGFEAIRQTRIREPP